MKTVTSRPAESAGVSGAAGLIVARLLGVQDPDLLVAIGTGIGVIPALVTLVVANGGIKGALRLIYQGR